MRTATREDVPALVRLVNLAFRVEDFFIDGDRTYPAEVETLLGKGRFLVEERDGAVVACIYYEVRGERGYFGLLSVEPALQRARLGRGLVDAAEAACRAAGCRVMDLQIVNLREELPAYYSRLGYVLQPETAPFVDTWKLRRPCHFIKMTKPL